MSYRSFCSDGFCGAEDCTRCYGHRAGCDEDGEDGAEEVTSTRYCIARIARPRYGIRSGDLIRVVTGFTYEKGGPRLGYLSPSYLLVSYGPSHPKYNREKFVRDCATYLKGRKRLPKSVL